MTQPFSSHRRTRRACLAAPASVLLAGALWPGLASAVSWQLPGVVVQGSGRVRREERAVGPFSALKLGGDLAIELRQGDRPRLEIEADDNILPLIDQEMHDTSLRLLQRRRMKPTRLQLVLVTPQLDNVDLGGAAALTTEAWQAPRLSVRAGGSASLRLRGLRLDRLFADLGGAAALTLDGAADELVATLGGSALLRGAGLDTREAALQIGGAASAVVTVREHLKASVGGAGSLRYHGQPRTTLSRSGAATVQAMGDAPAR